MPPKNKVLKNWKASVPKGFCPGCRNPLPPPKLGRGRKRRELCGEPACRKKYLAVRQQGTRPPVTLRLVSKVAAVEGKRGRVLVTFSPCGHRVELHRSKVGDGEGERRRKCSLCARQLKSRPQTAAR